MSTNLTVALVIEDGAINQDKSEAAFRSALSAFIADKEVEGTLIGEAVSVLFDQYKGAAIAMPTVASLTAQRLGAVAENYKSITERVADYVRSNSDGKGLALYAVSKGKGGGCRRVSDIVVKSDEQK